MLLKFFYTSLILILGVYFFVVGNTMNKEIMIVLLSIVFISLIFFFIKKEPEKKLRKNFITHSTLSLIGLCIVFFQYPLDFVLDNVGKYHRVWYDTNIVLKALVLSVIGLLSFLLGYSFYYRKKNKSKIIIKEKPNKIKYLLIFAAISLGVYIFTVNPLYLAGNYGSVEMGGIALIAIIIFKGVVFALVIQKCRNFLLLKNIPKTFTDYLRKLGWPILFLILIYLILVAVSGDRGPLIFYSLLLIGGYLFVTKKKISLKYTIFLILIGAFFISLLGIARSLKSSLSFSESIERAVEISSRENNSFSPQTEELAGSIMTLHGAVSYVPNHHDFFYGTFQLKRLLEGIPLSPIFYPLIFGDMEWQYQSSSTFITWILQGDNPTYGNGSSCVAEFYLDFGILGVIMGMFFFGYLMRLLELVMYENQIPSLFICIVSIVYLTNALYIARSGILIGLGNIIAVYLLLLFNKRFLQGKR